jgi:hypothetical protein
MTYPFLGLGFNTWVEKFGTVIPGIAYDITYGITNTGGTFNLRSLGTVDYEVEWGDGNVETSTINRLPHTYAAGDYELTVNSDGVYRPYFSNEAADATQITSVAIGSGADLGTNLTNAWNGASNMTTFTCSFDVTSSVTNFFFTWSRCSSLTSFPSLDTSSVTNFYLAWFLCTSLTSFPSLDTSSGTNIAYAWYGCTNLTDFPANMFDTTGTLSVSAFTSTWTDCALTTQSIENILVSLDTNGATGITLGIEGGDNAPRYTGSSGTNLNWSAAAETAYNNLDAKGWTINYKDYDN